MSLYDKLKTLIASEPEKPAEPAPEPTPAEAPAGTVAETPTVDAAAIVAENETLRAEVERLKAKEKADEEKAEASRVAQIDAEVKAFMAEHGPKMGKELHDKIETAYRGAKLAGDESRASEIKSIVQAIPPVGQDGRVSAGGPAVDRAAAVAGGDIVANPDAERHAKISARAKKDGVSFAEAYSRIAKEEKAASNG